MQFPSPWSQILQAERMDKSAAELLRDLFSLPYISTKAYYNLVVMCVVELQALVLVHSTIIGYEFALALFERNGCFDLPEGKFLIYLLVFVIFLSQKC